MGPQYSNTNKERSSPIGPEKVSNWNNIGIDDSLMPNQQVLPCRIIVSYRLRVIRYTGKQYKLYCYRSVVKIKPNYTGEKEIILSPDWYEPFKK